MNLLCHRHFEDHTAKGAKLGAVTVIQRFGGALNLNPHFHTLIPEVSFRLLRDGTLFRETLPEPNLFDLEDILGEYIIAAGRILERWGVALEIDPVTDALTSASTQQTQLFGPQPGEGIERQKGEPPTGVGAKAPYLSAQAAGFSLNAAVYISADEGDALERLCRYITRPPVSDKRLQLLEDDRVVLQLRRPWADGTKQLIFDPLDFIARLAALIPAPRVNLVRYHGVFAPASPLRRLIVRGPLKLSAAADARAVSMGHARPPKPSGRRRLSWAALMMRVFGVDVLLCPACQGRMRLIAHIEDPAVIARILTHLALSTTPPFVHPARPPPTQLDWLC